MNEFIFLSNNLFALLIFWFILTIWGLYVSTYRALIDRVRAGVSIMSNDNASDKLLSSLLAAPNHERPFHIEAALISSLQVIVGTVAFYTFFRQSVGAESLNIFAFFFLSVGLAFLWERAWAGIASHSIAASSFISFGLKENFLKDQHNFNKFDNV